MFLKMNAIKQDMLSSITEAGNVIFTEKGNLYVVSNNGKIKFSDVIFSDDFNTIDQKDKNKIYIKNKEFYFYNEIDSIFEKMSISHNDLLNRNILDAHTIDSITGLAEKLNTIELELQNHTHSIDEIETLSTTISSINTLNNELIEEINLLKNKTEINDSEVANNKTYSSEKINNILENGNFDFLNRFSVNLEGVLLFDGKEISGGGGSSIITEPLKSFTKTPLVLNNAEYSISQLLLDNNGSYLKSNEILLTSNTECNFKIFNSDLLIDTITINEIERVKKYNLGISPDIKIQSVGSGEISFSGVMGIMPKEGSIPVVTAKNDLILTNEVFSINQMMKNEAIRYVNYIEFYIQSEGQSTIKIKESDIELKAINLNNQIEKFYFGNSPNLQLDVTGTIRLIIYLNGGL